MSFWLTDPADISAAFRWVVVLSLSGFFLLPLVGRLTPDLPPASQAILAKLLGWLVAGYAGWLPPALGIGSFHSQAGVFATLALVGTWALARGRVTPDWRVLVRIEAIFLGLFVLGLAQRLAIPDLSGLEKPTNLGFLTALMQADTMPPEDAWFAGHGINYYYLGHAAVAVFGVLADVRADQAYQLAMASLFAMTGAGVGAVVFAVLAPGGRRVGAALAALAGAAALYSGNLHSFLYTVLRGWMPTTKPEFYYPDSTRFIGFDPETDDHAFTEFTSYAFKVGDLHAHVLAIPIFLAALLLLYAVVARAARGASVGHGSALMLGSLIGLSYGVNAWDVAILGIGALLIWVGLAIHTGRGGFDHMAALAIIALASAIAAAIPFAAHFRPFSAGIAPAGSQTPIWQLLVIHAAALPALLAIAGLAVLRRRSLPLLFAAWLGLWGLVLILLPEILRVDDIYGQDYARANTMFKLTFRAQTILLIATTLAVGLLAREKARASLPAALLVLAPVIATFAYAEHTFQVPRAGQSLDGLRHLGPRAVLADYLAHVSWPEGGSLIEAPSDSFTGGAALATASGRPSVIGWSGHVHLWHDAPAASAGRHAEIQNFYSSATRAERCRILRRYNVAYIAFTTAEQTRFPDLRLADLETLGYVAIDAEGGQLIRTVAAACDGRTL